MQQQHSNKFCSINYKTGNFIEINILSTYNGWQEKLKQKILRYAPILLMVYLYQ